MEQLPYSIRIPGDVAHTLVYVVLILEDNIKKTYTR